VSHSGPESGYDSSSENPKCWAGKPVGLGEGIGRGTADDQHDGRPSHELNNIESGCPVGASHAEGRTKAHHGRDTPTASDQTAQGKGSISDDVAEQDSPETEPQPKGNQKASCPDLCQRDSGSSPEDEEIPTVQISVCLGYRLDVGHFLPLVISKKRGELFSPSHLQRGPKCLCDLADHLQRGSPQGPYHRFFARIP
jgi:hypothetical protein